MSSIHPDCASILKIALGEKNATPERIKEYENYIRHEYRNMQDEGVLKDLPPEKHIETAAKRVKEKVYQAAAIKYRNALVALDITETNKAQLEKVGSQGRSSLDTLLGTFTKIKSFKNGIDERTNLNLFSQAQTLREQTRSDLEGLLQTLRLKFGEFKTDPEKQRDLYRALAGEKASKEATELAAAIRKVGDKYVAEYRAAGGDINILKNHTPRRYDRAKLTGRVRQALADLLPLVDRDKYRNVDGSLMSDADLQEYLRSALEGAAGEKNKGRKPGKSIARPDYGLNRERHIHFKNADAEFDFMSKYGVVEPGALLVSHFTDMRVETLFLDRFGAGYKKNIRDLIDFAQQVDEANGVESVVAKTPAAVEKLVDVILYGNMDHSPRGRKIAQAFQEARRLISSALLGGMGLNVAPDNAGPLMVAVANGISFETALGLTGKNLKEAIKDPTIRRKQRNNFILAKHMGAALQDSFTQEVNTKGLGSVFLSGTMTYSLARAHTSAISNTRGQIAAHTLLKAVNDTADYAKTDDTLKAAFTETEFQVMRELAKGTDELDYEAIENFFEKINEFPLEKLEQYAYEKIQREKEAVAGAVQSFEQRNTDAITRTMTFIDAAEEKISRALERQKQRAEKVQAAEDRLEAAREQDVEVAYLKDRVMQNIQFSRKLFAANVTKMELAQALEVFENTARGDDVLAYTNQALKSVERYGAATKDIIVEHLKTVKKAEESYRNKVKAAKKELTEAKKTEKKQERKESERVQKLKDTITKVNEELVASVARRDAFMSALEKQDVDAAMRQAVNLRRNVRDKFAALVDDAVRFGNGELTGLTYSKLAPKGTFMGEMQANALQFSASPIMTVLNNTQYLLQKGDTVAGAALAGMYLAQLFIIGAVVTQAQALLTGSDPYEVLDEDGNLNPATLMAFATRGIGTTQVMKFFSASPQEQTEAAAGLLLGPFGSYALQYLGIVGSLAGIPFADDPDAAFQRFADKSIRAVKQSIPFQNLWYSKLVTDHMIFLNAQQALAPDVLDRRTERREKLFNTDHWYDPREDFPDRLPLQKP